MTKGAGGEGIGGLVLKLSCMFSMSSSLMCFSMKGVPRILYLMFATAKGMITVRDSRSVVV